MSEWQECALGEYAKVLGGYAFKSFEIYNGEGTVFGSITKDGLNGLEIHLSSKREIFDYERKCLDFDKKQKRIASKFAFLPHSATRFCRS
jgi:hypothetical protein